MKITSESRNTVWSKAGRWLKGNDIETSRREHAYTGCMIMYRAVKVSCRYSGLYTMNEGDGMQPYHLKKVGISTL